MAIVSDLKKLVPMPVKRLYRRHRNKRVIELWEKEGMPVPPPHALKQSVVSAYQRKYGCDTLVETGTYHGAMVEAQMPNFKTIYSIEIDHGLWSEQAERFRKRSSVHIIEGDSGMMLKTIVPELTSPAVFWLDGHYSGTGTGKGSKDCPIYEELDAIFGSDYNHVLLIDDARCFDGTSDYPTIPELFQFVKLRRPGATTDVKHDIIRIVLN
jgi:hypothetical protein